MAATVEDRIAELDAFEPTEDKVDNEERLQIWVDKWEETPDKEQTVDAMFALLERYPEDTTLGEPGPLIHAIEQIPGYENSLAASLDRMPSYYGVWMVNRILTGDLPPDVKAAYLELLHKVIRSDNAPQSVKLTAEEFIEFQ